jgi:hypothetical protein
MQGLITEYSKSVESFHHSSVHTAFLVCTKLVTRVNWVVHDPPNLTCAGGRRAVRVSINIWPHHHQHLQVAMQNFSDEEVKVKIVFIVAWSKNCLKIDIAS